MKGPLRYSRGRIRYTGRVDDAAFRAWTESPTARPMLDPLVARKRFALFGKERAIRRQVWQELGRAVRQDVVASAIQAEIDLYLARLDRLVFAHDLPRVGIDLHRLVAVPRLFVNAAIHRRLDVSLESQPVLATLDRREVLRDWFILQVIESAEAAVVQARPSPGKPVAAGDGWIVVGVNERFEWRVPIEGPAWPGHYYVLELTRSPITRAVRAAVSDAIARMDRSLSSLTRVHRNEILREAGSSLDELLART